MTNTLKKIRMKINANKGTINVKATYSDGRTTTIKQVIRGEITTSSIGQAMVLAELIIKE